MISLRNHDDNRADATFDQPLILFGLRRHQPGGYALPCFFTKPLSSDLFGSALSIAYVTFMFILVFTLITGGYSGVMRR